MKRQLKWQWTFSVWAKQIQWQQFYDIVWNEMNKQYVYVGLLCKPRLTLVSNNIAKQSGRLYNLI